ncbi:DNA cytosine methyltransferase [Pseudonocardia lutea]|uniref:DNA (cytosine-5-)-methyltransferase n=1 Tax=Pseudonocardia lutea TaxID=2172015 RepID=A0ABW1I7Y0_9PSEU
MTASGTGPRVIDLFSGAGGLSEGFRQAGYNVRLGLDFDAEACRTHAFNHPDATILNTDVHEVSGKDLLAESGFGEVDVMIGGPSCQGFSTQGRRGSWASEDDPRNMLYRQYARLVGDLRPEWFVMENVPGLLWFNKGEFGRRIFDQFESLGYQIQHKIVLAADFGVPQLRRRLMIVGNRVGKVFQWPEQTHMGAVRRDAIALWEKRRLEKFPHLERHLTLWDAISDLPAISAGGGVEERRYTKAPLTAYQAALRGSSDLLFDHQATPLPQVHLDLIKHVAEGQTWREIPQELLPERFAKIRRTDGTNLFARPDRNRPSYTIITQFGNVTTGAYTHPNQDRAFTAREGARIQSFPDDFRFIGNLTSKYRQIGNAVPPLLARRMAEALTVSMSGESAELVLDLDFRNAVAREQAAAERDDLLPAAM